MREIRFRAWNGDMMSKPFYPWALIPSYDGGLMDIHGTSVMWIGVGWTWLQFTGLKDKNGKEIYEGDILKWGNNINDAEDENIEVKFKDGAWGFDDDSEVNGGFGLLQQMGVCGYSEIIGNIYENPELLPTPIT